MPTPRFSIVIPTRNRHETLHYAVKTCLNQGFEDFEVIVADNSDSPQTLETLQAFDHPKIRYVKPPSVLSMTGNFEFGVSHANGEYVMVIGDDDGLLPEALAVMDQKIQHTGVQAICAERIFYKWPSTLDPRMRNQAMIPLGCEDTMLPGELLMSKVVHYETSFHFLPSLYHSAVHRKVLRELKERTGRIFASRSPDLYSGFAVAYLVQEYLFAGTPFTIAGISGKSNGASHLLNNTDIVRDFEDLNSREQIACHPRVPLTNSLPSGLADSFEYARDALFPHREDLTCDRKVMILNCIVQAVEFSDADRKETIQGVINALADDRELLTWVQLHLLGEIDRLIDAFRAPEPGPYFSQQSMTMDVYQTLGIQNTFDLSVNIETLKALHKITDRLQNPQPSNL